MSELKGLEVKFGLLTNFEEWKLQDPVLRQLTSQWDGVPQRSRI
jgi:hypothetical protein